MLSDYLYRGVLHCETMTAWSLLNVYPFADVGGIVGHFILVVQHSRA